MYRKGSCPLVFNGGFHLSINHLLLWRDCTYRRGSRPLVFNGGFHLSFIRLFLWRDWTYRKGSHPFIFNGGFHLLLNSFLPMERLYRTHTTVGHSHWSLLKMWTCHSSISSYGEIARKAGVHAPGLKWRFLSVSQHCCSWLFRSLFGEQSELMLLGFHPTYSYYIFALTKVRLSGMRICVCFHQLCNANKK